MMIIQKQLLPFPQNIKGPFSAHSTKNSVTASRAGEYGAVRWFWGCALTIALSGRLSYRMPLGRQP